MSVCNDPKCPLIRQGTKHEAHDKIGDQNIVEQCNDPRCVVNRAGIAHNRHDEYFRTGDQNGKKAGSQDGRQEGRSRSSQQQEQQRRSGRGQETRQESEEDIMDRIFREVLEELDRQSRQRQARQQQQQHSANESGAAAPNAFKAADSRSGASQVPAGNAILAATSPHDIFGIPRENATCRMIKSRYRDLARAYDPSKGIINKSDIDKKISNEIMTRINSAYSQLNEIYGCRK